MLGSEPDLKVDVQNSGVPSLKRGIQKLPIFGWFTKTYECEYLLQETRYKQMEKIFKLPRTARNYISSKFDEL